MNAKIAIVTGGANGIGKGIVKKFLQEGIKVYIADIDETAGNKISGEFNEKWPGRCAFIKVDLTKDEEIDKLFAGVYAREKKLDILVNDAGIQIREWAVDFPMEQFDKLMSINLRSYYLCSRTAAKYMKERREGSIVCVSSVNSISYHSKRSPYNISKAAVNGLVGTLGVEWGRYNVRINAVAPGYVLTELMESGIRQGIIDEKNIMKVIPMKRYIAVEEVADAVYFFASDMSSAVTGQVLCVDGGWSKNALPECEEME